MKSILAFFFFSFVVILTPVADLRAEANGDCVASCTQKGRPASTCVPQCSQAPSTTQHQAKGATSTDYRCLNLCVNEGHPAAVCMPQCAYTEQNSAQGSPQPLNPASTTNTHRILETPMPMGEGALLTKTTAKPLTETSNTDYTCLAKCMQQGMQSQICRSRCEGMGPKTTTNR